MNSVVYKNVKKIYGPYQNNGRLRGVIAFLDGSKKTISWPKFLMQEHLGRELIEPETVDHIDGNPLNNDLTNLRIKDRSTHAKDDVKKWQSKIFDCPVCSSKFELSGTRLRNSYYNRQRGKAGPFCGRSCAGKASNQIEKFSNDKFEKEIY